MKKNEALSARILDMGHSLSAPLFEGHDYPWEVLPLIKEYIMKLGTELSPEEYEHPL